jgi:hypothetical protein
VPQHHHHIAPAPRCQCSEGPGTSGDERAELVDGHALRGMSGRAGSPTWTLCEAFVEAVRLDLSLRFR